MSIPTTGRARSPFRKRPIVRALETKFTEDIQRGRRGRATGTGDVVPNYSTLHTISQRTTDSIKDAENMRAVMPDIDLAESIITSSILSPNTLSETTITWSAENLDLPPTLINLMTEPIEEFFNSELPLVDMMPQAIRDARFRKGSYPVIVIPESTIDDIINGRDNVSIESMVASSILGNDKRGVVPLGILGQGLGRDGLPKSESNKQWSLEDLVGLQRAGTAIPIDQHIDDYTLVTDNPAALKMPYLVNKLREDAVNARMRQAGFRSYGNEALHKATKHGLTKEEGDDITRLMNNLYGRRNVNAKEVVRVQPMDKSSRAPIGHPLAQVLPPESMIVVHTPGNPADHLGYLIILDEMGYPLSTSTASTYYQDMQQRREFNRDQVSNILGRTNLMLNGAKCNDVLTLQELRQTHINYIELDMLERFRRGLIGENVEMSRPEALYDIMLARAHSKRMTQILWVPSSLVMYFAFDYNEMGIGQSVLDKTRLMGMVRSALTFANAMGAMKNSANHRKLTFRIDQDDMTPEETIERMATEYARVNAASTPFSSSHPLDIADQMAMANTSIVVEGAEDIMPDVEVSVEDSNGTRVMVDNEFLERVDKQFYMGLGVTQALMDSTADVQFAVAAINENLLFSRRIAEGQRITEKHFSNFARMYVGNSGTLLAKLIKIVQEYRTSKGKKGVEYERAPGSRLKGSKPEEVVKDEVREKLYVDGLGGPEKSLDDPLPTTDAAADETANTDDTQLAQPEQQEEEDAAYSVVTSNDTVDLPPVEDLDIVYLFLDHLKLSLPKPDSTKIEDQMTLLQKHIDAADKVMEVLLTDDMLSAVCGSEADSDKSAIKANIKAMYLRKIIAENNILPQLQQILNPSESEAESNADNLEEYNVFVSGLFQTIKNMQTAIKARHGDPDDSGSTFDSAGNDGGDDADNDFSADDEFGGAPDDLPAPDDLDAPTVDDTETEDDNNPEPDSTTEPEPDTAPPEEPEMS